MTWTQLEIDAWQAHAHRNLRTVTAAVLDLIDVGPTDDEATAVVATAATSGRKPSTVEQDATYRAGDDYQPTQGGPGAEFYQRPEARVLAWEAQIQEAVTGVFGAITVAVDMVRLLRVAPVDEHGRPLPPPAEPATREIKNGRRAGDQVVDIDPAGCRRHVLAAAVWLGAAVDAVAHRLRATTGESEVGEYVAGQAQLLGTTVRSLASRMRHERPADHPDTVRCGVCGEVAKYRRLERCDTCRRRELRAG